MVISTTPLPEAPKRRLGPLLTAWIAVLLPVLMAGMLILPYRVDVALWDDWERGPLLQKWHEGTLKFEHLFAAHIQHRMAVPRLVILASNAATHGNLREELAVNFAVIALTALGAGLLVWRSLSPAPCAPFVAFLVSALLCSPMQYQNYLWITTLGIAIPALALVLAIFAWQSPFAPWIRFSLCVLLALVGTFSFGHGILLWPCILLLIASGHEPPAVRIRLGVAWGILGVLTAAAYFHDLHNMAQPSHSYYDLSTQVGSHNLELLRTDPAKLGLFMLRMLGASICRAPQIDLLSTALWIGMFILALLGVSAGIWLARFGDADFRRRAQPWIVLGAYGVGCAFAVTWGRGGWETPNRALTPRYITMVQHALAAAIVLLPLLAGLFADKRVASRFTAVGYTLGGVFACWMLLQWMQGAQLARAWAWGRLQAKAQLLVLPIAQPNTLKLIDADLRFVRKQMTFLASKGFLNPKPLDTPWLDRFPVAAQPMPTGKGSLDAVRNESGDFVVSGIGFTPGGAGRPADAVLLCDKVGERWRIRRIADPDLPHGNARFNLDYEFTSQQIPGDAKPQARWRAKIAMTETSDSEWSAWILDAKKWKVTRIPGEIRFPRPESQPVANP